MYRDPDTTLGALGAEFQQALPHTRAPYDSRAWGHAYHSLCSYQGKLKPSLAHWMVRQFSSPGERVLDPLGGVGTVALEAGLLGRKPLTCDLSPFASCVASAKVAHPPFQEIEREFADFCGDLERVELTESDLQSANFGLNAKVCDYFHPRTLEEVLKAKKILGVDGLSPARNFIKASLLHILHGNRPYALSRTSHPITPFSPSGPFEYRSVAQRLDQRLERLKRVEWPDKFEAGSSWHADFRELPNLLADQVDAIICSPPFPGMRFDRPNWLRMWFCGWEAEDFHVRSREFLERQQGRTFAVYREFFQVSQAVLRPRGSAVLHVGGSKGYDMATKLIEVAKPFFRHRGTVAESVAHLEKHGIKDKGTTTSHILLLFERI